MENMVQIEVVKGPARGKIYRVPGSGFSIGRSTEPDEVTCALMDDVSVSRRHAVGRREGDRIMLEDWPGHPSKAGLMVGGKRLTALSLATGETVTLGRTTLAFHVAEAGKGLRLAISPFHKRWLGVFLFLIMVTAGTAALRTRPVATQVGSEDRNMERAWAARCSGDLEDAIRVLQVAGPEKKDKGAEALQRECQRYERLFEGPRRLEESLRLDEARDAWQKVALAMRADDPLRTWVETGCVARLSRQLAELRP